MTPFCVINKKKNALQIMSLAAYASETSYQARKVIDNNIALV